MRFLTGIISLLILYFTSNAEPSKTPSPSKLEIEREIKKLEDLRNEIRNLIKQNEKILIKIKEERKKLTEEKKQLEKFEKKLKEERYKKLAKVFEKAVDEDPELAAERISNIKDPIEAAYIIYNMKESKAGILMDYVDPKMADKIVRIIAKLRKKSLKSNN